MAGLKLLKDTVHHVNRFSSAREGFTLLEIMIALAIIGSTLSVVLHTVNYHTGIMHENIVTTEMYLLAKEKLHDLKENSVNSKGKIAGTDFTYENVVVKPEESDIITLNTFVFSRDKKVSLLELVLAE